MNRQPLFSNQHFKDPRSEVNRKFNRPASKTNMTYISKASFLVGLLVLNATLALSQAPVQPSSQPNEFQQRNDLGHAPDSRAHTGAATMVGSTTPSPNYILGPQDQILLQVNDLDELNNKSFRVDLEGNLNLPILGAVPVAGLTINQAKAELNRRLTGTVKNPDIVFDVTDYRSQPITLLGAVSSPGVYQVQGRMTLFQVLSLAGGPRSDAGSDMTIMRKIQWGAVPLPGAHVDASGQISEASISMKTVLSGSDPAQNIPLMPDDVLSVPKAQVVYAVGSVIKPGGYMLGDSNSLSALQVVALSSGFDKVASPSKARILRVQPGTSDRLQIPINLKEIVSGKAPDISLKADDILFVPDSKTKIITQRTLTAAVSITSGLIVYGKF